MRITSCGASCSSIPRILGTLLSFLATRQIFTGAGRVGQASPLAFEFRDAAKCGPVDFQISQRADHIVNDIYQWVQFNRAIINARDEPLADYRKYRRLHLLIGDSNMSPFATALKIGTTALLLSLLEEGSLRRT
jgi:proteasome accessory factor A